MRIMKLNENYKTFILEKYPHFHKGATGLFLTLNDYWIFVPLTSREKEDKSKNSKFLKIIENGMFYGSLLINNYIYVNPKMLDDIIDNTVIANEMKFIRKNEKEILKRVRFQINFSKETSDIQKKQWLEEYLNTNYHVNKLTAKSITKKAIQSMAIIEKISFSEDELDRVLELKILERADTYEIKTVFNLKDAWEFMILHLEDKLTLNFIKEINYKIANHQALVPGELRTEKNYVSGIYEISVLDLKQIESTIYNCTETKENLERTCLELFYSLILNQWFWDGNKRTAFLVLNKLLISNGLGYIFIETSDQKEFEEYLNMCYMHRDVKSKNDFFIYLSNKIKQSMEKPNKLQYIGN